MPSSHELYASLKNAKAIVRTPFQFLSGEIKRNPAPSKLVYFHIDGERGLLFPPAILSVQEKNGGYVIELNRLINMQRYENKATDTRVG
jgi:hypothetical protein